MKLPNEIYIQFHDDEDEGYHLVRETLDDVDCAEPVAVYKKVSQGTVVLGKREYVPNAPKAARK